MGSSQGLDTLVDARGASGTFDVGYLRPVQGDENTGNILMERELQTCVRSTDGGQSRCPAVGVQLPRHAFGDPEGGERVGGIRPDGDENPAPGYRSFDGLRDAPHRGRIGLIPVHQRLTRLEGVELQETGSANEENGGDCAVPDDRGSGINSPATANVRASVDR